METRRKGGSRVPRTVGQHWELLSEKPPLAPTMSKD